ncbi:DEAD/DEAH box helicase [Shewanella xiamenensis]|uniref:DEAD/DEAH box helicase n=1 Tax=Shewanella xiamenensis TaxID=332186 RepID=UPI002178FBED|nr:DEAD/DEAH box helicase [Shewanella xiamenensis]BDQ66154.1 DEAD/DEAH box helicase [Shewanella xiamenensis]GLD78933.1 DEAD/DEAH box helicase [Shewanella xiamenensis]
MKYFTDLIEQSLNRTREATLSMIGVKEEGLREHLSAQMSKDIGEPDCFLAPPLFEHTFGWEQSNATFASLSGQLLNPLLVETLANAPKYQFPKTAVPYKHQLQAWRHLLSKQPTSAIVTTGTGSGKTECFMVPILNDLIGMYQSKQQALVGISALFLYPLNALINSQQERLDAWTKQFGHNIRFCLYNGNTKESETEVRKEQKDKPNQILSRERLRKEPAPILMTNATMLEYMLVRQIDDPILKISRENETLRWIVLDEAHTYVGSQAAELSLLLRRVVQAFGAKPEEIRFVATSATIADENAKAKLERYLADLAGIPVSQILVVTGQRIKPTIDTSRPLSMLSLSDIITIESKELVSTARYKALEDHHVSRVLRDAVVQSPKPLDFIDLYNKVSDWLDGSTTAERQQNLLLWLDVMTGTTQSKDSLPFLKLRAHLFQRMLHGLWSCVDKDCKVKSDKLQNYPFGKVYVSQRVKCDCGAPVYELAFCTDCKTPHLVAEDVNGVLKQPSTYAGDEFTLNVESSDGDSETDTDKKVRTPTVKRTIASVASSDYYARVALDLVTAKLLGGIKNSNSIDIALSEFSVSDCSNCGLESKEGEDFLRKAYLGAPFYVANAVPTVLEFCPDADKKESNNRSPEDLPGRGRKLITFTDSRQGTARMAVRMQHEAERSKVRGLVFNALRARQLKENLGSSTSFNKAHLQMLLETAAKFASIGLHEDASNYRIQAEALLSGAEKPKRAVITHDELVNEIAATKDICQSILKYNRHTNPELFNDSIGPKIMARLLLAREFSRRPKNQNSTETLGLIQVTYQRLDAVNKTPDRWTETTAHSAEGQFGTAHTYLTLQDWRDFLKVALDYYVRENTFVAMDRQMQQWMGSRFVPKQLFSPLANIQTSTTSKTWPQIKQGIPSRLVKLLEVATGLSRDEPIGRDKINSWLQQAWSVLTDTTHILEKTDNGYQLKLETLAFSLPDVGWVCPFTRKLLDTTFRGLTPYLPRKVDAQDYRCRKVQLPDFTTLKADSSHGAELSSIRDAVNKDPVIKELRAQNLWTDISDRTVEGGFYYRTAEHSAQQSANTLEKYEELFKSGDLNVLNCSTTMEMGVDIGGISAVVMNNVPPHPANYLQRAGRAGRRSEARAIAYTLCKADPHNQRAFTSPKWPFVTTIAAPKVTLSSARIVQRHVNSALLATFLKLTTPADSKERTKLIVAWFYDGTNSPCQQFCDWLRSEQSSFSQMLVELVAGTALAGISVSKMAADAMTLVSELQRYWLAQRGQIVQSIAGAIEPAYKKALELELDRHDNDYLLRDLASRAFLPGYGFPTNVVTLNNFNIEDWAEKRRRESNKDREDNIFTLKEKPSRSLDVALREYAPGASLVIDGRVYKSAGVQLQNYDSGSQKCPLKFDLAWVCHNCGATGVKENAYSNKAKLACDHCSSDVTDVKTVLRPVGFSTDFFEATSNDITSQKFIKLAQPRVQVYGETFTLPDPRCGFVRFGHDGTVFHHSSGEHENGYAICLACGRADSMTSSNTLPNGLELDKEHRPIGGATGATKEKNCSGHFVKPNVHLGYHTQTDVLEVALRNPITGNWLSDLPKNQVIGRTIAVALRDAIAENLGIASSEMGFSIRLDRDLSTKQTRTIVQIFDNVSGGAGFALSGLSNVQPLLLNAFAKLRCPAKCENVCSHCLASSDSRVEQQELDRESALEWVEKCQFGDFLRLPTAFNSVKGAELVATGPVRFIRTCENLRVDHHQPVKVSFLLHGGSNTWDLSLANVKDQILTWKLIDKIDIELVVKEDERLDNVALRQLQAFKNFGVEVRTLSDKQFESKSPLCLVLQITVADECYSVFTNNSEASLPNEFWLKTDEQTTWVSTKGYPYLPSVAYQFKDAENSNVNASVIEITDQLNGGVDSFGTKFLSLVGEKFPEIIERLNNNKLCRLSYSDRYLKSPWAALICCKILQAFALGKSIEIDVNTVAASSEQIGRFISHDWQEVSEQRFFFEELLASSNVGVINVKAVEKSTEIQHSRVLSLHWSDGTCTQLIFDQGVGYWKVHARLSFQREHDFYLDAQGQLEDLNCKMKDLSAVQSAVWPTYVMVNFMA